MSSTAIATRSTSKSPSFSTPLKKSAQVVDSPGNWRHPRLEEITRRQNATVFNERNIRTIVYNVGALAALWVLHLFSTRLGLMRLFTGSTKTYVNWGYLGLQLIPLLNIGLALLPLVRRKDDLSDIPLTPSQRKLLGLPPAAATATPNSVYSTPPRYSRTPSISGSVASKLSYSGSPASAKGSPASGGHISGSPYSPAASPLLQKAVAGGLGGGRRTSFGSASPLGASTASSLFPDAPGTPTPSTGKRTSVSLNNKWLYGKGRRSSGSAWS